MINKFWNNRIGRIETYSQDEFSEEIRIKLDTNENPYGTSEYVNDCLKEAIYAGINRYPNSSAYEFKEELATRMNLSTDQIYIGNGSDEVLAFIFQAFFDETSKIAFWDVTYPFYKVYTDFFNIKYDCLSVDERFQINLSCLKEIYSGVIIANPNAMTGVVLHKEELIRVIRKNPETLFVVDEAYIDFIPVETLIDCIDMLDNLIIVQTFSKAKGLAGLRIGIAYGNKNLINALNIVKNSINYYPVNRLAIAGGIAVLNDEEYVRSNILKINAVREEFLSFLKQYGFIFTESVANFVLIKHPTIPSQNIWEKLKAQGISIRRCQQEKIKDFLRVTIGTEEEMTIFKDKLLSIIISSIR